MGKAKGNEANRILPIERPKLSIGIEPETAKALGRPIDLSVLLRVYEESE